MTEFGNIGFVIFAAASVAFVFLTAILVISWKRGPAGVWMIAASSATFVWAATSAFSYVYPQTAGPLASPLETIRTLIWGAFFVFLISRSWSRDNRPHSGLMAVLIAGAAFSVLLFALDIAEYSGWLPAPGLSETIAQSYFGLRLALAICGLALVENFYRNTDSGNRWGVRMLCLGIGGMFGYDVYLYADAMLFHEISDDFLTARGAIITIIAPLIAVSAARNPTWKLNVFISRRAVFHTVSFVGSGVYLIVMAGAGYYLREVGGEWGTLLQVSLFFGTILLLIIVLFSGRARAQTRVFFNKHFFNYNYDYREEWLRFIRTVSSTASGATLQERVVQAICDIFDSPGGHLWLAGGQGAFKPVARWNFQHDMKDAEPTDSPFVKKMSDLQWVINLDDLREDPGEYQNMAAPKWVEAEPRAWLAVPLIHHDQLIGFIVLERPRAAKTLDWEDFDLLKTVGRQAGSYIAEQLAEKALVESQQFEAFNQRFAFVMHDIKNLVSQLSLLLSNAEKYADNPEFQKDMLATIQGSVDKMNMLLGRLHDQTDRGANLEDVNLSRLLQQITGDFARIFPSIELMDEEGNVWVTGETQRLQAALVHLIQNAIDAVDGQGEVSVSLAIDQGNAIANIRDTGPGMDEEFVRTELFRPFRTTKDAGYGIGAYESRQIITDFGGKMQVESTVGQGTNITLKLPLSKRSMAQSGTAGDE